MSEWALSLGWSAADQVPNSDDDDDVDDPLLQQQAALEPVYEDEVKFTDTPFTIAARNAQVRKARQLVVPQDEGEGNRGPSMSHSAERVHYQATPTQLATRPANTHPHRDAQVVDTKAPTQLNRRQHPETDDTLAGTSPALPLRQPRECFDDRLATALSCTTSENPDEALNQIVDVLPVFEPRKSAPVTSGTYEAQKQHETLRSPAKRHESSTQPVQLTSSAGQLTPPSVPSEVIVISSDSEGEDNFSTVGRRGSNGARSQLERYSPAVDRDETTGEQVLQQLFDENHDFYESLDREMGHQARSDAASSVQMESMIPDGSTSYETFSCAATQRSLNYQAPHPIGPTRAVATKSSSYGYQPHFAAHHAPMHPDKVMTYDPAHAAAPMSMSPLTYDAYGRIGQYPRAGGAPYIAPVMAHPPSYCESATRPCTGSGWTAGHPIPSTTPIGRPSWHSSHQQPWNTPAPSPYPPHSTHASYTATNEPGPSTFAKPKTPRQAQEAKKKADLLLKALNGASKRARTESASKLGRTASSHNKENEWSTLKASRTTPDGTLSLTAAMRRPIPATRLAHSSRGGNRLALPLYRTPGSSAEARRKAESLLLDSSSKSLAGESSARHFSSGKRPEAAKASKLFQPSPLSQAKESRTKR